MKIKIKKVRPNAILPEYQTKYSAGMDLCACIDSPMEIKPMERKLIPTGIAVELPCGYEAQIRARSGLSYKNGITMANGVGTVDSDYRGEYNVMLINVSRDTFIVEPGMRIAQLIISRYEMIDWQMVDGLSETERGAGGFGSTGKR